MNAFTENRLDPSMLDRNERQMLALFGRAVSSGGRPALVDADGNRLLLPEAVFRQLVRMIEAVRQGQAVVLLPEKESFTTQAAANFLGVSRPFLVRLLESDEIPHHRVGAHRRIYLRDLLQYRDRRDRIRRKTLDDLTASLDADGLYDAVAPEHAR